MRSICSHRQSIVLDLHRKSGGFLRYHVSGYSLIATLLWHVYRLHTLAQDLRTTYSSASSFQLGQMGCPNQLSSGHILWMVLLLEFLATERSSDSIRLQLGVPYLRYRHYRLLAVFCVQSEA